MAFFSVQSANSGLFITKPSAGGGTYNGEPVTIDTNATSILDRYVSFQGQFYPAAQGENTYRAYYIGFYEGVPYPVLDIPAFSHEQGAKVQLWTQNGGRNQLWTILPSGTSGFVLRNVESGLVVDVPAFSKKPGTVLQQWGRNFGANQEWDLAVQSNYKNQFSVAHTGRDSQGDHFTFTGHGFEPNTFAAYLMNAPGADYSSTCVPFGSAFESDAHGNFSYSFVQQFEFDSQSPGDATCVLEIASDGFAEAFFRCSEEWFNFSG